MTERRPKEFMLTKEDFSFLAKLVYQQTGIVLAEHKRDMVYSRLARRIRALNLFSFREYCDYVNANLEGEELGQLVNAITTNLTSFFREKHHFEHLKTQVLEPFFKVGKEKKLRIWSAGCSQGSEPYSIAMVVADCMEKHKGFDVKILATDIDTNMLARGRSGSYRMEDLESIPTQYRKYISVKKREGEEGILMAPKLREMITFNQLNLLAEPWPMKGQFDVIFCRNVVIYFDKPTQKILFNRYADQAKSQAWLYIGHSENLFNVCDRFKLQGKTIYRKAT